MCKFDFNMAQAVQQKPAQNSVFTEEEMNTLSKKYYGLSDKDIEELIVFINEFDDACKDIPENAKYDDLKAIVDAGNKIPSHCGHMIMSYFVNRHGDDKYNNLVISLYNSYTELFEEDPESTKTTDIYETLACMVLFAPHKTLRKLVQKNFSLAEQLLKAIKKRPSSAGVLMARYSELYVTTKHDEKYAKSIMDTFKSMIDFLKEKNGITEEIQDAVSINFNELRNIIADYLDNNKKERLKSANKLINKKADIGQAFFTWVAENPSCAIDLIQNTASFDMNMVVDFLKQMKIQHILETTILLQFLTDDKLQPIVDYIKNTYKLETFDDYFERLVNIVQKGGVYHYGILLRHIDFLPQSPINEGELSEAGALRLQDKLSSVANNLTADISEKSLSITIAPLGRSRVYQDIVDKLEGIDTSDEGNGEGGGNSFLAKLRDKDVIKKIRESGASYLSVDQYCGSITSTMLEIIQEVSKKTNDADYQTFSKECYKVAVLKYGIIYTLRYFNYVIDTLLDKCKPQVDGENLNDEDPDEDYEDIEPTNAEQQAQ